MSTIRKIALPAKNKIKADRYARRLTNKLVHIILQLSLFVGQGNSTCDIKFMVSPH